MVIDSDSEAQTEMAAHRLRFVIYRPHSNIWFRNTVGRILKKKRLPNKYAPFLDYVLQGDVDVFFTSGLIYKRQLTGFLKWLWDGFELVLWCIFNRISLKRVSLIFTKKGLVDKDVLFLMHYGNFTSETENDALKGIDLAQGLADVDIHKIVHVTHYAYCPVIGARNLAVLHPDMIVAENNLAINSNYYKKYFSIVAGKFNCLPYTPAYRFQNHKTFEIRTNKLVVTGSITYKMKSPEFIAFFEIDELQPMRRRLYEEFDKYKTQMDCLISDLDASRTVAENNQKISRDTNLSQLIESKSDQGDYYKKDIVEIYNSYTMFAVPEEICGLPAIGFVEGMACGSVYFGLDDPMYRDIGMYPGIHYVSYDGTVVDLMSNVNYYQEHPVELIKIRDAGYKFVLEKLNSVAIYSNFFHQLTLMSSRKSTDND